MKSSQIIIKGSFDFLLAIVGLILVAPIIMLAWVVSSIETRSNGFFLQNRIGKNGALFTLAKIKTMKPVLGFNTNVTQKNDVRITTSGAFFRKTKIDELPQLWSILKGDMSFVGPRPALFNQDDLIFLRTEKGVDKLMPGLTGWAQVNGRDDLPIPEKVALDVEYMERQSFWFDMRILWLTVLKVVRRDGVSH